ncbi:MAG: hypothetical protein ACE5HD_05425 [Acidobacteriota bacterium]
MRFHPHVIGTLVALAVGAAAPVMATDSLVFFKNGRTLRVLDYRDQGNWVFLRMSEPHTPRGSNEQEVSELGVLASSIERIESVREIPGGQKGARSGRRSARGAEAQPMSEVLARAAAASSTPGGGTFAEALDRAQKTPNIPSQNSRLANHYKPSGGATVILPGQGIAGEAMRSPLRRLGVRKDILQEFRARRRDPRLRQARAEALKKLQEQTAEREAKAKAGRDSN